MKEENKIKWSVITILLLLLIIVSVFFTKCNALNDIAFVKMWDKSKTNEPFAYSKEYYSRFIKAEPDDIGILIKEIKLNGYDEYYHEVASNINTKVYEIKGINPECAGALKLPFSSDYYVYTNSSYHPNDLGEFLSDLNLIENLSFNSIIYDYSEDMWIEYTGITKEDAVKYLFENNQSTVNVYSGETWYEPKLRIKCFFNTSGFDEIILSLSEDGYLFTDSFSSPQAFYIGEDKVNEFMNFLKTELEAREMPIIYIEDKFSK